MARGRVPLARRPGSWVVAVVMEEGCMLENQLEVNTIHHSTMDEEASHGTRSCECESIRMSRRRVIHH